MHFGMSAKRWILEMFNKCISKCQIPKLWHKARTIALLKPGKDPGDPKSYRPISLLCHTYKLMERMILNRISEYVDMNLIHASAGWLPTRKIVHRSVIEPNSTH